MRLNRKFCVVSTRSYKNLQLFSQISFRLQISSEYSLRFIHLFNSLSISYDLFNVGISLSLKTSQTFWGYIMLRWWKFHTLYIYINIFRLVSWFWGILIGLIGTVFANGPGDLGSIPGRVISKTLEIVLDTSLLNTQ